MLYEVITILQTIFIMLRAVRGISPRTAQSWQPSLRQLSLGNDLTSCIFLVGPACYQTHDKIGQCEHPNIEDCIANHPQPAAGGDAVAGKGDEGIAVHGNDADAPGFQLGHA